MFAVLPNICGPELQAPHSYVSELQAPQLLGF